MIHYRQVRTNELHVLDEFLFLALSFALSFASKFAVHFVLPLSAAMLVGSVIIRRHREKAEH